METHTCEECGHEWPCSWTGDCEVENISRDLHGKVICMGCLLRHTLLDLIANRPSSETVH
jgi:hypothetical protein